MPAFAGLIAVVALKIVMKPVGTNPLILSNGTLTSSKGDRGAEFERHVAVPYYQNGILIKMEHSYYQKEHSSKMEHSYYQKEHSSKMEHSYYQNGTLILSKGTLIKNGTLILSKRNTHQNGTLLLSKWNTHIIKRNTHQIIIISSLSVMFSRQIKGPTQEFVSSSGKGLHLLD